MGNRRPRQVRRCCESGEKAGCSVCTHSRQRKHSHSHPHPPCAAACPAACCCSQGDGCSVPMVLLTSGAGEAKQQQPCQECHRDAPQKSPACSEPLRCSGKDSAGVAGVFWHLTGEPLLAAALCEAALVATGLLQRGSCPGSWDKGSAPTSPGCSLLLPRGWCSWS